MNQDISSIQYEQLDCSIFRVKTLKYISYDKSMGEGTPRSEITPPDEWRYPQPNTVIEFMFNKVCEEHQ